MNIALTCNGMNIIYLLLTLGLFTIDVSCLGAFRLIFDWDTN